MNGTYEDKELVCLDCRRPFLWAAGEQQFYARKELNNEPKRCQACRQARRAKYAERDQ